MASRKEGAAVVVSPSGRLNGVTAPALEAKLRDVAMHNDGCTVLDCREIVYISSAGLRAILIGAKVCMKEGGELVVAALQPECRAVMAASGLLTVVKYHRTVAAALAAGSSVDPEPEQGPGLEIGEWHDGGTAILSLNGRLDSRGAQVLMATISASVDSGRTRMMLDCRESGLCQQRRPACAADRGQILSTERGEARHRRAGAAMPFGHGDERFSVRHRSPRNPGGGAGGAFLGRRGRQLGRTDLSCRPARVSGRRCLPGSVAFPYGRSQLHFIGEVDGLFFRRLRIVSRSGLEDEQPERGQKAAPLRPAWPKRRRSRSWNRKWAQRHMPSWSSGGLQS